MVDAISVVIPVYNSEKSLNELHEGLSKVLSAICRRREIILVDDGSRDESYREMCRLHSLDPTVKVVRLDGNYGQQNAIMCGLRQASGDYIVTMDDDLQHPPEEMIRLIEKLKEGFDVVYGIPAERRHSAFRSLGTGLADFLFDRICGKPKGVKVSSFRVLKRSMAEKIAADTTSFVYITAITLKHTKNIASILVVHEARKYGQSNYSIFKLFKLFYKLFVHYTDLPWKTGKDQAPQYVIKEIHV